MKSKADRIFASSAALYGFGIGAIVLLFVSAVAGLCTGQLRGMICLVQAILMAVSMILCLKDARRDMANACAALATLVFTYNLTNLYVTAVNPAYILMGGFGKFLLMLLLFLCALAALALWLTVTFPHLFGEDFRKISAYLSLMFIAGAALPILLIRAIGMGTTFDEVMYLLGSLCLMPALACLTKR